MEYDQLKQPESDDVPKQKDETGATCGTSQTFNNTVGALAIAAAVVVGTYLYRMFVG